MSALVPITLHQGNAETVSITITRSDPTDDLTLITSLRLVLKPDRCASDTASPALVLTTSNPAQMIIVSQAAAVITAEAYIPGSALTDPYDRWWRVDAYIGSMYRTVLYGPVTVIDL